MGEFGSILGTKKSIFRKVIPSIKRFQEEFSGKQTNSGITSQQLVRVSLNQQVISGQDKL
ncbi:hypothetical protein SAMN04488101_102167 [Pedobacter nyackensis]|uniref:Uncharacterized protein n=1 Tax=Pedobacter nyackensis TaxID=475255 RepID=A0A1W2B673_9SPHI|nr:hypothetical protein SAMN04488101_102167 [Pedobacter nyackensis]